MVEVANKAKLHGPLLTASDRVQEEQVGIEVTVEEEEDINTSTKSNKTMEDTTRSKQLVNDNTVCAGDNEEQNEAPNPVPNCEKETEYTMNGDNESVCTVYISELDDDLLLPKDRKSIDEALECERSLRLQMCLFLQ